ncbi:MAG: hypothetical protein H7301_14380 [Cryobacterium sp.]|nr:hypothetical protein [Oligoflexia bacterium]
MKVANWLIPFSFIGFSVSAPALASFEQNMVIIDSARPDLTIQSIFSEKAQAELFQQIRSALIKSSGFDPLSKSFDPIHIDAKIDTGMAKEIRGLVEDLLQVKVDENDAQIDIEGLSIETPGSTLRLHDISAVPGGLNFSLDVRLKNTVAFAKKIRVRLRPNPRHRSFADHFYVELKNTSVRAASLDSLSMDIPIRMRTGPDGSTKVGFDQSVLKIFDGLRASQLTKEITLHPGEISTPPFTLQIGNTRMPMRAGGLKEAVERRKGAIAKMMISPLADEIRDVPRMLFGKKLPEYTIPALIEYELPCFGKTGLSLLRYGQLGSDQLQAAFRIVHPDYPSSTHGVEHFDESTAATFDAIDHNRSNVVIGLGYRAISWALGSVITGCMKDTFPKDLILGPKGIEVRMDQPGNGLGVFALHAQTKVKWLISLVLGKRIIEFPIKVAPRLEMLPGSETNQTHLSLHLSDADLSNEVLLQGYSTIPSNLQDLRLKKMVLKKVRGQLQTALGTAKIDLPLAFAQGKDLKFAEVRSDGFGNLNLNLTLDPEVNSQAKDFWSLFTSYMTTLHKTKGDESSQAKVKNSAKK